MDIVKGAKLLAELFEHRGVAPAEKPEVDAGAPLFQWVGVHPPEDDEETVR